MTYLKGLVALLLIFCSKEVKELLKINMLNDSFSDYEKDLYCETRNNQLLKIDELKQKIKEEKRVLAIIDANYSSLFDIEEELITSKPKSKGQKQLEKED